MHRSLELEGTQSHFPVRKAGALKGEGKSWLFALFRVQGLGFPGVGMRPPAPSFLLHFCQQGCLTSPPQLSLSIYSPSFAGSIGTKGGVSPFMCAFSRSFLHQIFIKHLLPHCAYTGDIAGDKCTRCPPPVVYGLAGEVGSERERHWSRI